MRWNLPLAPQDDLDRSAVTRRPLGITTRSFHWITAALLVASFGLAWIFNALGPGSTAAALVEWHRTVGLLVLGLTLVRLGWRAKHPLSPVVSAAWERWLARVVQGALYLALLAMPILGWTASNAQGDTVFVLGRWPLPDLIDPDQQLGDRLFSVHESLGFVILALAALHIAGALRHHFIKRDDILIRMIRGAPR